MTPPKFLVLILLLSASISIPPATSRTQNFLTRGSSLSVDDESDLLTSPDESFTCGFYGIGENAYWFSIWFTNSKDRTVVWMANRGRPVSGRGSRVSLRREGIMVLADADGSTVWQTNITSSPVERAELLDSGNLVLKNRQGSILWQSFDFPTDTLLPNQLFTKSTRLTSRSGRGSFSPGYYTFYFDSDNALKLIYDGPDVSSIYWPNPDVDLYTNGRTNYNSSRVAVLDDSGSFMSSDRLHVNATDRNAPVKRRLTMDYDGNLRLYSLDNSTGMWVTTWEAVLEKCRVHGICGRNGFCVYTPEPKCSCPDGYEVSDPANWNKGCKPKFNRTCSDEVKFVEIPNSDFYGSDLNFTQPISFNSCKKICLDDCRCEAFSYRLTGAGLCFAKSALFNGFMSSNFEGTIYLKLPKTVEASQLVTLSGSNPKCGSEPEVTMIGSPSMYDGPDKTVRWPYFYYFALAIGTVEILFGASGWWFLFQKEGFPGGSGEDGYHVISSQFRRFSYGELRKATINFKEELGRGAFGAVYKGRLADDREVAVKKLGDVYQGEEGFWAEVSTIGKMNHMNLVRMWGFCYETKHKLLVYEHIKNKSLDKHLFSSDFLGWKERFKVCLGVAKGLAYLHHECLEWVFHCDVKPENILLDEDYEPKIADFGLAKLSQRNNPKMTSELSRIRGTKGYMAPEWAMNLPITAKVDVYSYGVVILEMVKGIRLSSWVVGDGAEQEVELMRFVKIVKGEIQEGGDLRIEEMVDPRLNGKFSRSQATKMVEIGISCVEEDRHKRPTMDSVVQILLECEDRS